jgi:hypothetical protein
MADDRLPKGKTLRSLNLFAACALLLLLSGALPCGRLVRAQAGGSAAAARPAATPQPSGGAAATKAAQTTATQTTTTPAPLDINVKASERAIDESVAADAAVEAAIAPYSVKVRRLASWRRT